MGLKLWEARESIGEHVIYSCNCNTHWEGGIITSVDLIYVWVQFDGVRDPKPVRSENLELLEAEAVS
jgi:hypothetical protein